TLAPTHNYTLSLHDALPISKAIYKRQVLELGGNDPIIVMEDADLAEAATLAAAGSYKNSGQRCTAVKRMIVQETVADRFVELLLDRKSTRLNSSHQIISYAV